MDKSKIESNEKTCQCNFCHAEIPLSAAVTPEAMDYTRHFCGNKCYEKWKKEHPSEDVSKF